MRSELRFRQVHLDFHTSEHIPDVGAQFDKAQFTAALKTGNVNSITVFARGHHGWCYYPTKIGSPHPNLKRPDLLGEMVEACRENNINVPIYLTVQWDELTAREHPEWRVMSAFNRASASRETDASAMNQLTPAWHPVCLNNPSYLDYLEALTLEVVDRYHPDGLFMDILLSWECVCPKCLRSMEERRLDPEKSEDRRKNDREVIMAYYRRLSEAVWRKDPDMRIFHNSGHIFKGERDRYRYFSHLEVESLPTGGWGYDHFPVSARYINTLGMEYLGMTGKFHTTWGEFGGYKRPVALEYECAAMVAFGARCSVGDQLHPSGMMDVATYETIGPAYRRVERIEPFATDATPVSEIAVVSSTAHSAATGIGEVVRHNPSDDGAARMLLELHEMFDVIDLESDFSKYRLLVLPDTIKLDDSLAKRFAAFVAGGGKLILTGASGLSVDESGFALDVDAVVSGRRSSFEPDFIEATPDLDTELPSSPFVMYERAWVVRARGKSKALAGTRVPYFNRAWDHFSSHQHAPYRTEANPEYDAVIQQGSIVYFAHPVFSAYYWIGQPLYKYLVRGALNRLFPDRSLKVTMPSSGRVSLMEQKRENRLLLHLLFAQTQLRGTGSAHQIGEIRRIEIIEDVVPVRDVACSVRLPAKPSRIYSAYTGTPIPFGWKDGTASFTVPELYIHELIVIDR